MLNVVVRYYNDPLPYTQYRMPVVPPPPLTGLVNAKLVPRVLHYCFRVSLLVCILNTLAN